VANARLKVVRRPSSTVTRRSRSQSVTLKRHKVNPCHKQNPSAAVKKALALSERFHQLVPRRIKMVKINWPKALMQIGGCVQINYLSDKFDGKPREYFHRFEGPAVVYTGERLQADGSCLLVIKGKFKITKEGIIG